MIKKILFFFVLIAGVLVGSMLDGSEFKQKTIGLIGGTSWESTVLYYQLINRGVREELGGLNSAKLLIYSVNYEPIIQLENQGNWTEIGRQLEVAAKTLENAGADMIILCCNTLHKVAPAIESAVSIPFVHIATSAGKEVALNGYKKIGLLGTRFTMEDGFYSSRLENDFDLQVIVPDFADREVIDKIIYDELCVGTLSFESKKVMNKIIDRLCDQGVEVILLGCTELGLLIDQKGLEVPIFDTTLLHSQDVVKLSLPSV